MRLCLRSKMTIHNPFNVTLAQPLASILAWKVRVAAAARCGKSRVRWPRNAAGI